MRHRRLDPCAMPCNALPRAFNPMLLEPGVEPAPNLELTSALMFVWRSLLSVSEGETLAGSYVTRASLLAHAVHASCSAEITIQCPSPSARSFLPSSSVFAV